MAKIDLINKNIETLLADMRKLAENQQKSDKMLLEIQAGQADLKPKINAVYEEVLDSVESKFYNGRC
jgi:ABC-type phosphate transport system auxiliary subunit